MAIILVKRLIADLKPHPRNPRRHPEPQLTVLRDSLRIHGQQKPVVISPEDVILACHGLVEAMVLEGWTEVECHVYDGPFPDAFLVIDNYSADLAVDDQTVLAALLVDLQRTGQLPATGFTGDDLGSLLATLQAEGPQKEEDWEPPAVPLESEPTRVQPNEIWGMGQHRLFVGDCTIEDNWDRLMRGKLAHSITTDPPYGVNYTGVRGGPGGQGKYEEGGVVERVDAYWDVMKPEEYRSLILSSLALAFRYSDDAAPLYVWFASSRIRELLSALDEIGWQDRNLIAWVRNNGTGSIWGQYKPWYEPVYYCFKRGKACRWHGPSNERTVWEHDKPSRNELHPTMKNAGQDPT